MGWKTATGTRGAGVGKMPENQVIKVEITYEDGSREVLSNKSYAIVIGHERLKSHNSAKELVSIAAWQDASKKAEKQ